MDRVTFRKTTTPGLYDTLGCPVPHGRDTHFDSECSAGAYVGQVRREVVSTPGFRGTVTETLWEALGEDGRPLKVVGDAGLGWFLTRTSAGEAVLREAREAWGRRPVAR